MACRKNFIYLAQELVGSTPQNPSSDEAKCRSAVSRAYYGAFNQAKDLLIRRGKTVPKKATHQAVLDLLDNSGDFRLISIGQKLSRLRGHRNEADYGGHLCIKDTKIRILQAMEIQKEIDAIP